MGDFETMLREASKPLRIILFEPVIRSVFHCQSHIISVNKDSLHRNYFEIQWQSL